MSDRMTALRTYLEDAAARPFSWDGGDCILFPADWRVAAGCPDPAAAVRGRYRTAIGARRLIKRNGGLLAFVTSAMGPPAGEGVSPAPGDVGLVRGASEDPADPTGAICAGGGRWAVKTARGIRIAPFTVVSFWSF